MLFTFSHCSIKFLSWPLKRRFTADYSEKVRAITDMNVNTIVHLLLLFSLKISCLPAKSDFFIVETEDGEKVPLGQKGENKVKAKHGVQKAKHDGDGKDHDNKQR